MEKKHALILPAEESFARRVALDFIVKRPGKPWLQLIPGMFIFDFLKRNGEIRRCSQYYLFPRRLAMDVALNITKGDEKNGKLSWVEEKIKTWPSKLSLDSQAIHQGRMALVNLLIDHYIKLFQAHGDSYNDLLNDAYQSRENYETFLNRLSDTEREMNRIIFEVTGEVETAHDSLKAEQLQAEEQRNKELDNIFFL